MNERFRDYVESLDEAWQKLQAMPPVRASEVPNDTPVGGVYLFSENGVNLYAGRTKRRIASRIRFHFCKADDCPFAWLLAREATGKKATYTPVGSRYALLGDPSFEAEYERGKQRIRNMQVRYVYEHDPWKQALLEMYVAVAAQARYNDFDTH